MLLLQHFLFAANGAQAESGTIKGDAWASITEAKLDEMVNAATDKDYQTLDYMNNQTCFNIKGRDYRIVKRKWGKAKIRIWAGGSPIDLWMPAKFVRPAY